MSDYIGAIFSDKIVSLSPPESKITHTRALFKPKRLEKLNVQGLLFDISIFFALDIEVRHILQTHFLYVWKTLVKINLNELSARRTRKEKDSQCKTEHDNAVKHFERFSIEMNRGWR